MSQIQPTIPVPFLPPDHRSVLRLPELIAQVSAFDESTGAAVQDGGVVWGAFEQPLPGVWVEFMVRNGGGDSAEFWVRRQILERWSERMEHDPPVERVSLPSGRAAYWSVRIATAGIYEAVLGVDLNNEIREHNEIDNSASLRFVLTPTPG